MIAFNENGGASAITLTDIEAAATAYDVARCDLADTVRELEDQIAKIKAPYMKVIRREVAKAAEKRAALHWLIELAPGLFEKPRTQVFAGIKVGYRKGSGGIDWEDDARTVALIRKNFPKAQADLLIKTTEKPIAKALQDLDVSELKRIGCTVESTGDVVVIKPADSEVEKLVNALLKDATERDA